MKKVFAFGLDLEVEDWVKFLAVDEDGDLFGFEFKHKFSNGIWVSIEQGAMNSYLASIIKNFLDNEHMIVGV